jgi:carnitine O-acetyltransferase
MTCVRVCESRQFLQSGAGHSLHDELQQLAVDSPTSWLEGFWDSAYLEDRGPAPINVNPFFVWNDHGHPTTQLARAAALTFSSLKFYESIRQQTLAADKERDTPLCMTQFGRLFGTCRIPHAGRDKLLTFADSKHIVVACGGCFFALNVIDGNGGVLSHEHITAALQSVVAHVDALAIDIEQQPDQEELRVGILGTDAREHWARARSMLLANSATNQHTLQAIDTALFILCLDTEADNCLDVGYGVAGDASLGSSMVDVSRSLLHSYRGRNRWFDKLQIIVMANGKAGINMEHSPYDGHTVLNYATSVHDDINGRKPIGGVALRSMPKSTPQRLNWTLDAPIRAAILSAQQSFDAFIARTETAVLEVCAHIHT